MDNVLEQGVFIIAEMANAHEGNVTAAKAIVEATTHYNDPKIIAEVSKGLGDAMAGLEISAIPEAERLAGRGW